MPLSEIILVVMGLLAVSMLVAGLFRNLPIPYTVVLVTLGLFLGWLARTTERADILLEFQLTPELVLFIFLPALIFESAFNMNTRQLVKDLPPILAMAIPALLMSTALIGTGLWLLLDMELIVALLFGVLISATDPVAVISLFKELGVPERLTVLVEGESLLNDATAIVVFNILLVVAISGTFFWSDTGLAVFDFLKVFIGGAIVGILISLIISELLYRFFTGIHALMIMSIVVAYSSFIVAEHIFYVSGVMAVVSSGIILAMFWITRISKSDTHTIKEAWEVIALVSNSLLFLLVGLAVDIPRLLERVDIIFIAIVLVLLARAATIYSLVPLTVKLFNLPKISFGEKHIMFWGGLKGGLAIAIVLSIPENMVYRDLLLDMTLGVVMFSLLVNASTVRPLIHLIGLDKLSDDERTEVQQGLRSVNNEALKILNLFDSIGLISRSAKQLANKKIDGIFEADNGETTSDIRYSFLKTLRVEFDTLKNLYEIGLIQHYIYFDIKNILQNDRENFSKSKRILPSFSRDRKTNLLLRIENAFLKRAREVDWATFLLTKYQELRLSQSMQRDIARVLICKAVLEMLQSSSEINEDQHAEVIKHYQQIMQQRRENLLRIAKDFPEFYKRFENNLCMQVSLRAVDNYIYKEHQQGGMGTKAYIHIEEIIRSALDQLPSLSADPPKLTSSDLIGTVPILHGLSENILWRLAKVAKVITFLPEDIVIGDGDKGDALYIISHGLVSVTKNGQILAELRDGDFFGEMGLLGDQLRTATVTTLIPSTLLRLRRKHVLALATLSPELDNRLREIKDSRRAENE